MCFARLARAVLRAFGGFLVVNVTRMCNAAKARGRATRISFLLLETYKQIYECMKGRKGGRKSENDK
jgi:hypothetical protein